ncbi:MAG: tRNA epoxyqueuosine(34) reductase QueG [Gemmatimonadales bacterium]
MTPERRAHLVKARALELGFDAVGITHLEPIAHGAALTKWLERGMAGHMTYMHRQARKRLNPAEIVPGASRAVVVTRNYYAPDPPRAVGTGRVAKYARGRDYHETLKRPLRQLANYIRCLAGTECVALYYVDAGPVAERELAQRAGIGWIGKNTMLIDPRRGSFVFLATVLTDAPLAIDSPFEADRCGTCTRCLTACPAQAFTEPRVLDSRRCISYLTIEHRGQIDPELAALMDDWVFGCDVCQDVCPWNTKFAHEAIDEELELDSRLAQLHLTDLAGISAEDFDRRYGRTPLERAGTAGMRRNATIARHNQRQRAASGAAGAAGATGAR